MIIQCGTTTQDNNINSLALGVNMVTVTIDPSISDYLRYHEFDTHPEVYAHLMQLCNQPHHIDFRI